MKSLFSNKKKSAAKSEKSTKKVTKGTKKNDKIKDTFEFGLTFSQRKELYNKVSKLLYRDKIELIGLEGVIEPKTSKTGKRHVSLAVKSREQGGNVIKLHLTEEKGGDKNSITELAKTCDVFWLHCGRVAGLLIDGELYKYHIKSKTYTKAVPIKT